MAKINTTASAIKMTFEWEEGEKEKFEDVRNTLCALKSTVEYHNCETIGCCGGYEITVRDLEDAIGTLDIILEELPSETEIYDS